MPTLVSAQVCASPVEMDVAAAIVKRAVTEQLAVMGPVVKVFPTRVPMHPDAVTPAMLMPAFGVTAKVALAPYATVELPGVIPPAAANVDVAVTV